LGDCLGGRVEPVGASFEGAAIDVYDGAVNVPGLSAFARRRSQPPPVAPEVIDGEGGAENPAPPADAAPEEAATLDESAAP
jgi:hypothetical protein